ncbi:MAG: hypothetical protein ACI805_001533, partial [Candidatus Azotimanducaceae bacterium]
MTTKAPGHEGGDMAGRCFMNQKIQL